MQNIDLYQRVKIEKSTDLDSILKTYNSQAM